MHDLLIRIALGSPCLGIAVWMMLQPSGNLWINMLGVFPCLIAFSIIIAPSSTSVAASVFKVLFMPERDAQERPDTRRADRLRFNGQYDEALIEYERILQRFPDDLKLWNSTFEIVWIHLRDATIANEILNRALAHPDPERRLKLKHLESVHRRRYVDTAYASAPTS